MCIKLSRRKACFAWKDDMRQGPESPRAKDAYCNRQARPILIGRAFPGDAARPPQTRSRPADATAA
jgi:hypothetical protein